MTISLEGVRYPLPHFCIALDTEIGPHPIAVTGPSGAGKTTILELIAGLRTPGEGRILHDGRLLADARRGNLTPLRERGFGLVPQEDLLFRHLSVRRNILYGAVGDREQRVSFLADALGIAPLLGQRIAALSGGERRRVALARALATSPRLLLLDEPFAGMDQATRAAAVELIRLESARGAQLVLVSHDETEARMLCERRIAIAEGKITATDWSA